MYIHQVTYGTKFTFSLDEDTVFEGIFEGNIDHMSFNITCPDISRNYEMYHEKEFDMKFFQGENNYTFKAKLYGMAEKKDTALEFLQFRIITAFKETPVRSNFRIKIGLKVRVHEYTDDFKKLYSNGWLCDAVSDDISKNGIRLWSDFNLDAEPETMFTLEFSLKSGIMYMVPTKLVRCQPNTATRSYAYDYGFLFDFSEMPEKQERLILDILEHKIKYRL